MDTELLIIDDESEIIIEVDTDVEVVELGEQGPRGIQGIPGPAGGNTYEHTQAAAAAVWTVAHNLARYPSVTVTDHFGEIIAADVKYLDENIVRVTHGAPVAGFAYLN